MRIVISEFMDEAALLGFGEADVLYDPDLVDDRPRLLREVASADVIVVRNRTQVDVELLDAAPRLRVVGRLGVGLDNIDMDACAARNVSVHPATGANTDAVAEYVIAAALLLVRGAFAASDDVARGEWPRGRLGQGGEIGGRVMGLVGFGGIGRAVAKRAAALGMTVTAHDPGLPTNDPAWGEAERLDIDTLLARADVVSLHVPLIDATRNLIDAAALDRMKDTAVLVNTARGGVVDEAALADALREDRLGGAALDVFEDEPLEGTSVERLRGVPNLILTPHIAGVTAEANKRVSLLTVENVMKAFEQASA